MLLPKGRPLHQDLGTAYVKMDHLIRELKEEGFSGYLRLDNPSFSGILFFEQGKISGAYTEPPSSNPLLAIMEESSKEGTVNVYGLPPEVVYILASSTHGEDVYGKLPLEIINMDRLMERLERDSFTGVMRLEDDEEVLMVLLFEGGAVEYLYEGEEALQGEDALGMLERFTKSTTASLSLYKSGVEEEELEFDPQEVLHSLNSFFAAYQPRVEVLLGKGRFERVFREASLSLAEEFHFLDPFAPLVRVTPEGLEVDERLSVIHVLEGVQELVKAMNSIVAERKGEREMNAIMDELASLLKDEPFLGGIFADRIGN